MIPVEAVEAAKALPLVPVTRIGCPNCYYNPKYGVIACKEHRGW